MSFKVISKGHLIVALVRLLLNFEGVMLHILHLVLPAYSSNESQLARSGRLFK